MLPPLTLPRHSILSTILRRIDSFIFPPLCIVCDTPRQINDRWLCHGCRDAVTTTIAKSKRCPRCGQNREIRKCTCDIAWEYPFAKIISFTDYTDTIQIIMQHIKYHGKRDLAWYMGTLCASHLDIAMVTGCDIVIPIPLHWIRRKKRGYNQAEWFARGLCANCAPHKIRTDLLARTRSTRTQTNLDKPDRNGNVAGAFALNPHAADILSERHVLLIDDVITTGATTSAATKTLLSGGCSNVTVLSLARD
jgi:ComF family protein